MSAIHYSQMLCQLSYGEANASSLVALHHSGVPSLLYEAKMCEQTSKCGSIAHHAMLTAGSEVAIEAA
jgi:hypothetical protein